MWGTNPTFFVQQFAVPLPLATNPIIATFLADGDAILESIFVCFDNENFAADSPVGLRLNGSGVPFPSALLLTITVGNGIQDRFPLNLFLKKGDSLAVQAIGWQQYEGELDRLGSVLIRYWTL